MTVALTPRPADFADHVNEGVANLCRRYGVGKAIVIRWRAEIGAGVARTKASKDDYERIRELVASGLSAERVGALVGCGRKAIVTTVARQGLGPWRNLGGAEKRDVPADFAEHFARMSVEALAVHYAAGTHTVRRWAKELNISRRPGYGAHLAPRVAKVRAPKVPKPATVKSPKVYSPPKLVAHHPTAMLSHHRDMSAAGQAADYLRQFGAVWRCSETGRPDPAGKCWRRGSAVLSDAEIVERADWMRNRRMAA